MARADDTSSTIDWIWLRDALELAAAPFGSEVLAKERLRAWLASGQLPWSCMSWEGPDADDIARLEREDRELIVLHILPSAAYREGDPQFWRANPTIWWEKNAAREFSAFGARALGIKVSRKHLLALLPKEPSERGEADGPLPANTQPAEKPSSRPGPQMRRVLPVLKKLYPPNGTVPDDVLTETVRARVSAELAADSKNQELAAPSWDTVNRALGRG